MSRSVKKGGIHLSQGPKVNPFSRKFIFNTLIIFPEWKKKTSCIKSFCKSSLLTQHFSGKLFEFELCGVQCVSCVVLVFDFMLVVETKYIITRSHFHVGDLLPVLNNEKEKNAHLKAPSMWMCWYAVQLLRFIAVDRAHCILMDLLHIKTKKLRHKSTIVLIEPVKLTISYDNQRSEPMFGRTREGKKYLNRSIYAYSEPFYWLMFETETIKNKKQNPTMNNNSSNVTENQELGNGRRIDGEECVIIFVIWSCYFTHEEGKKTHLKRFSIYLDGMQSETSKVAPTDSPLRGCPIYIFSWNENVDFMTL